MLGVKESGSRFEPGGIVEEDRELRVGKTLGEQVLWLALFVAGWKYFISNWLARRRSTLSEHLSIEASGKIVRKD